MWAAILAAMGSWLTGFLRMWREPTAAAEAEKAGAAVSEVARREAEDRIVAAADKARLASVLPVGPGPSPRLPDDGFERTD